MDTGIFKVKFNFKRENLIKTGNMVTLKKSNPEDKNKVGIVLKIKSPTPTIPKMDCLVAFPNSSLIFWIDSRYLRIVE